MEKDAILFKRKMYDRLLKWKRERNGESAILIQGARRIGKSTVAEEFARNEYESYILIDFAIAPAEVQELFNDISDLNYIFLRLQLIYRVQLIERKSAIIFDEIQKAPLARQAIKHLVKDRRYDYIETGSLITVHKSSQDILLPSEETRIDMFPMDYEEFRWALGDTATIPLLRTAFEKRIPLGDAVHRRMMRDFRLYMLVGGMPKAVAEYIKTNNLGAVDLVKRDIVEIGRISVAIGWTNGCAIAWVNAWVIRMITGIVADFGGISGAIGCAISTDFTRIVTLNSAFSVANGEVMQAVRGRRALLFAGNVLQKPGFAERASSVGEKALDYNQPLVLSL